MESFVLSAAAVLGLLGLGGGGADLVLILPADTYFQSRRVPVNIDNMLDLAKAEPASGKAQIQQLMALRVLAEQPELLKKAKDAAAVLRTIEKIAKGELAKDRLGFSQEYATHALIAMGGKITQVKKAETGDPYENCLGWFPASATLVGFVDGGRLKVSATDYGKQMRALTGKLVRRQRDWNDVFHIAEMIGNVRIERISFAYSPEGKDKDRLFVRLGGKGDHKRIADALKVGVNQIGATVGQKEDAKGTMITTMDVLGVTAIALIGDTDFVVAGPGGFAGGDNPNPVELRDQLLAVRAGKEMSVLKGALKDRLPKASKDAVGLL